MEHIKDFVTRLKANIVRWKEDISAFEAVGAPAEAEIVRGWVRTGEDLLSSLKDQGQIG